MANTKGKKTTAKEKAPVVVNNPVVHDDPRVKQVFRADASTKFEDLVIYASTPGIEIEFDVARPMILSEGQLAELPVDAVRSYNKTKTEIEEIDKASRKAIYEAGASVDPMTKLLDGPHGMSNPLTRDAAMVQKLLPDYYITWRVEGGQGDLDIARRAGFRVMRRPKDDDELENVSPLEWNGEVWRVRDGTVDPTSGDEIYNVMVAIRAGAWKDNLDAMSMISHNAYSTNKKQFVEGVDNISRDMLSARERIQVSDLDEMHVEEHTVIQNGKRVSI